MSTNTINPKLVDRWRETLVRKSASRLLEVLEDDHQLTNDEAEAFIEAILHEYDKILEDN